MQPEVPLTTRAGVSHELSHETLLPMDDPIKFFIGASYNETPKKNFKAHKWMSFHVSYHEKSMKRPWNYTYENDW